jgi:hypothetical protein
MSTWLKVSSLELSGAWTRLSFTSFAILEVVEGETNDIIIRSKDTDIRRLNLLNGSGGVSSLSQFRNSQCGNAWLKSGRHCCSLMLCDRSHNLPNANAKEALSSCAAKIGKKLLMTQGRLGCRSKRNIQSSGERHDIEALRDARRIEGGS